MNINVGIIEDELFFKEQLLEYLDKWASENVCDIVYHTETSGEDFLSHPPEQLDILFLDIQLDGINGVELAYQLRDKHYTFEIVFLTGFREYVFQGYQVRALNYLLKPVSYTDVKKCMDIILEQTKMKHYIFKNKQTIFKIPYSNILYYTSCRHYIDITTTETTHRQLGSLKVILPSLPPQFMQCHRTTIVNIHHIQCINGAYITMSNDVTLPVSKTYLASIRDGILNSII